MKIPTLKKRTHTALLAALLFITTPNFAMAKTATDPSTIPPRIINAAQAYLKAEHTSGMTIIYIEKGLAPTLLSLGSTDYANKGFPITASSRFEIGSLTKLFTGLLAAECVQSKACDLNASLPRFLPNQQFAKDLQKTQLVELLTHTSGLPSLPSNFAPKNPEDPYADYNEAQLKDYLSHARVQNKGHYSYSNIGFGLLGYLLLQSTGPAHESTHLQGLMQKQVLAPLGMTATSFEDLENLRLTVTPYANGAVVQPWHFQETTAGAGALRSSGEDMAKFLKAQMYPETLNNTALSKALIESQRILRNTEQTKKNIAMAYGWHRVNVLGQSIFTHSGQTGGFSSFIGFDSDRQRGAVILSNDNADISNLGFAMILPSFPLSEPKDERLSEEKLNAYLGRFQLAPQFIMTITQRRGHLYLQATGQQALKLSPLSNPSEPLSADLFKVEGVDAHIRFTRDPQGKVQVLILDQNDIQQKAPRIKDATD